MNLHAGRLLRVLRDLQLHVHLGFATLRDYAAERLGISLRTAQELMRVDEALERLPRLLEAWLAGEITSAHVRILSRVATKDDEERWVARARRMDVRALARAVTGDRERASTAIESAGSVPAEGTLRGTGPPRGPVPSPQRSGAGEGLDPSDLSGLRHRAETPDGLDEVSEPDLVPLSVRAPAWILKWWRETKAFVRRLTGSALPAGACLEVVLAESADIAGHARGGSRGGLRGASWLVEEVSRGLAPVGALGRGRGDGEAAPDRTKDPPASGAGSREEPPAGGSARNRSSLVPGLRAEDPARVARRVDADLRRLVASRQRSEAALADDLVRLRASGGYLLEGFSSLKGYARERLGLSPRMVDYLLALHRTLERLPDLRRAHLAGRLTLRQTLLVGRVATKATTPRWVRRAGLVTLRRLEDEVEYWELLREVRPEVWERLQGGPLPEGLVLVPGREPRVREPVTGAAGRAHESAPAGVRAPDREEGIPPFGEDATHACASVRPDAAGHPDDGSPPGASYAHGSAPAGAPAPAREPVNPMLGEDMAHASALEPALDAHAFIRTLETSEAALPLPTRLCTLRMRVEQEVRVQWSETIAAYRSMSDEPLEEWEAFALILRRFWKVWDNSQTRAQRRRHPAVERDGGRCLAPGCRAIGTGQIQEHHVVFRSAGGALRDLSNLGALCNTHHGHLLHSGLIRCRGSAPDDLDWELGVSVRLPPFLTYHGDVRTGGTAV